MEERTVEFQQARQVAVNRRAVNPSFIVSIERGQQLDSIGALAPVESCSGVGKDRELARIDVLMRPDGHGPGLGLASRKRLPRDRCG